MKKATAIVVAGGSGSRFGSELPKQFLDLNGKSILQHSLELFEKIDRVQETLLVLPEKYLAKYQDHIDSTLLPKLKPAIAGGERRQDSVANGLAKVATDSEIVLVHDAVRPLAQIALIEKAIECATDQPGAILAAPSYDTLKKVSSRSQIIENLNREEIWCAQTPQVFDLKLFKDAYEFINTIQVDITDEAQAMEKSSYPVVIIESTKENLKITTELDLHIAETILKKRMSK